MTASLVAVGGPSSGKRYPLDGECVLGRSFNSDIYIGDLNVSRRHARVLSESNGRHVVEDLGSGNGTFVNNEQVHRHPLSAHDVLRIGGSEFRYEVKTPRPRWGEQVMTVIADVLSPDTGEIRFDPRTTAQLEEVAKRQKDPTGVDDKRALKMLQSMYAVTDAIATELDLDKLLGKILDHLFGVFRQAERGFVLLYKAETGELVPEAVKQRRPDSGGLTYSQTIVDQVFRQKQGVIRGTPARPARLGDPNVSALATTPSVSEVLKIGSPLICRGESLGTLHIEGGPGAAPFSPEDLDLLSGIARQAALAITNAKAGRQLVEHERLEADLQMARKIQQSFLPRSLPELSTLAFETHYASASHVGGDFYDIIQLAPGKIGILVGDISGHGVAAALVMARLTTEIRLHSQSTSAEPAAVLTRANQALLEMEQDAMFATVLFILLDLEAKTFTISNAGHQPPIVCSSRFEGISELDDATAVALGVVPDMTYTQEVYQLVRGDVVLLYTDGINEAMNKHDEEYGMLRLKQVVRNGRSAPRDLLKRVIKDVRRFVGGAPQSDDQTLVAFGMKDGDSDDDMSATIS